MPTDFENRRDRYALRHQREVAARKIATHTQAEWLELLEDCDHRCVRCKSNQRALEKDHIRPISMGGSDGIKNIQPVCARCNVSKGPDCTDHRPLTVRAREA